MGLNDAAALGSVYVAAWDSSADRTIHHELPYPNMPISTSKSSASNALVGIWTVALTAFVISTLFFAREILIPLATEICRTIDVAGKRIVIEPPEGLLDLNA